MKSLNYSIARSFLDALYAIGFALRENPTSEQFAKFYKRSHHFNEYMYKNESNGFITFGEYQELKREYHRIQDQISALSESFMPCVDEVTDVSSVITTPVQPEAAATESNSTPGAVRLYPLLAESELCPAGSDDQIKTVPISASIPGDAFSMRPQP